MQILCLISINSFSPHISSREKVGNIVAPVTDEEIKAQEDEKICPGLFRKLKVKSGSETI